MLGCMRELRYSGLVFEQSNNPCAKQCLCAEVFWRNINFLPCELAFSLNFGVCLLTKSRNKMNNNFRKRIVGEEDNLGFVVTVGF